MTRVRIEFDRILRPWDGFGVNYVETSMSRDYGRDPQDYGGFSTLPDEKRREIVELVFGDNGLRPGLVKMFLDPFHQPAPGRPGPLIDEAAYDHTSTTRWMRYFVKEGLALSRSRGRDLRVITTMYGPPAWMTRQKVVRGRDLDPQYREECAKYIVAFAKYLRDREGIPASAVSLHNEGEDHWRWPAHGGDDEEHLGHDYNLYWSPEMVAGFIPLVRSVLNANGMHDVGVACGETSTWSAFQNHGHADAIADDAAAVRDLGIITSHGFFGTGWHRWVGYWHGAGVNTIRQRRPGIHAWVTSTSWSKMDARFVWEIYNNIHAVGVNAIIPWACIQNHAKWVGGDPNPGCAFVVDGKGGYTVQPGFHFFRQVCSAGQPGMGVARIRTNEALVGVIGFASSGTANPHSIVLINAEDADHDVEVELRGVAAGAWSARRSSGTEAYANVGSVEAAQDGFRYRLPAMSVTTLCQDRPDLARA